MIQIICEYAFQFALGKNKKIKEIHYYSKKFEIYCSEFEDKPIIIYTKRTMKIVIEIKINFFVRVSCLLG